MNSSYESSMNIKLDRLLEIERDIQANLSRGNTEVLKFHMDERESLINEIKTKLAMVNEQ